MSIDRVKAYFEKYNMSERIQEFEVSSATVELAALALNCEGCRIAKSLTSDTTTRPTCWRSRSKTTWKTDSSKGTFWFAPTSRRNGRRSSVGTPPKSCFCTLFTARSTSSVTTIIRRKTRRRCERKSANIWRSSASRFRKRPTLDPFGGSSAKIFRFFRT